MVKLNKKSCNKFQGEKYEREQGLKKTAKNMLEKGMESMTPKVD